MAAFRMIQYRRSVWFTHGVLESPDERVVGLEVKSHQAAKPEWFRWLGQMRDALGEKFIGGFALYAGKEVLPFGDRLVAVSIPALWEP
jgi:uncharacterized protein